MAKQPGVEAGCAEGGACNGGVGAVGGVEVGVKQADTTGNVTAIAASGCVPNCPTKYVSIMLKPSIARIPIVIGTAIFSRISPGGPSVRFAFVRSLFMRRPPRYVASALPRWHPRALKPLNKSALTPRNYKFRPVAHRSPRAPSLRHRNTSKKIRLDAQRPSHSAQSHSLL